MHYTGACNVSDETNDSFLARADVLWQDLLNKGIKVEELQAYVTLRGSNLGPEDKKKVIMDCDSVDGKLSMKKVASAVRMLGAGFFHEMTTGKRSTKLKVYDQAVLMAEDEDLEDGVFQAYGDELPLEEDMVESLAGDGDDDAMLVMEFESAALRTGAGGYRVGGSLQFLHGGETALVWEIQASRFLPFVIWQRQASFFQRWQRQGFQIWVWGT